MRSATDAGALCCDLDRLTRATGENDVMAPIEYLGDCGARFFKQDASCTAFAMRRIRVRPSVDSALQSGARFGKQRRCRGVVEIEAFG
jgi:hypothetical protein